MDKSLPSVSFFLLLHFFFSSYQNILANAKHHLDTQYYVHVIKDLLYNEV